MYPNICGTAICKNTLGKYECECPEGYTYNLTSKNCEGRSFLCATLPVFFFPLPPLSIFESTAIANSSISSSSVLIYLHIVYCDMTQLFFQGPKQAILCSMCSCSDLLPGIRELPCIPLFAACRTTSRVHMSNVTCLTVERTFCPSSQTSQQVSFR